MKRVAIFVAILLITLTAFAGEPATDNQKIVQELQRTEAKFLASIEGLSEEQWNFKPAPERWSIAECAEHIAAAEPMVRGMIAQAIAKEAPAEMRTAGMQKDEMLLKGLVDRSQKFKAPEPLIPTNRFGSPAEAVAAFAKERAETIKLAADAPDLRTHGDNHFLFGPLDGYGWFLFTSGHVERHTLQIEEVKTSPDYPKPVSVSGTP